MNQKNLERKDDEVTISSVSELLDHLSEVRADPGIELWFRGHADRDWILTPSVFRERSLEENEVNLINQFRQQAASVASMNSMDQWSWIVYAQHFSLPTRLLDWSTNPLVALYFACGDTDKEADGCFYILEPKLLNQKASGSRADLVNSPSLLTDSNPILKDYLPGSIPKHNLHPRAVLAPMAFDRIRFQSGTFTVSSNPEGSIESELENSDALSRIIVKQEGKDQIRFELEILGFDEATVFRDLDRIAKKISNSCKRSK